MEGQKSVIPCKLRRTFVCQGNQRYTAKNGEVPRRQAGTKLHFPFGWETFDTSESVRCPECGDKGHERGSYYVGDLG